MINLAGHPNADQYVADELNSAGISIVDDPERLKTEVSVSISGHLGQFKFTRAWIYYVVSGKVPLSVAQELYKDPLGKVDIRVVGHCGCPPPEGWITWLNDNEQEMITLEQFEELKAFISKHPSFIPSEYQAVAREDFPKVGKPFITSYHIDSQEGLDLFVNTLKAHNLV